MMHFPRRSGPAAIVMFIGLVSLWPLDATNAQGRAVELFNAARLISEQAGNMLVRPADAPTVARRRTIAFDPAGLDAIRTGRDLSLNLFADTVMPVRVDRFWTSHIDTFHWQGHVLGEPERTVLIVLRRGHVWASIETHLGGLPASFRIRSHQNLGQVVEEIDQDKFAPCGCGEEQRVNVANGADLAGLRREARQRMNEGGIAGPTECFGPTIDVLVMYTPEARDHEGGTEPIETFILGLEDATNNTYLNSAVQQRINIVHVAETGDSELKNFGQNLGALRDTKDDLFNEAHTLRDQYGADLVAMLISHTNGGICGIGYLMTSVSTDFATSGFTVTNTDCAQGGYTFQHELGHNMGCHHDHDNSGPAGAYTWSHGHRFVAKDDGILYRTVMAYAPGSRIGHFSNPDIEYLGTATGVPIGIPDEEADNAATLNATAGTVADFRPTAQPVSGNGAPWPPPVHTLASDAALGDRFGAAAAVSGSYAIVGAHTDDHTFTDAGSAYIFRFDPDTETWIEEQKLVAPDPGNNDRFGATVDIISSVDGDVAVIGSFLDDNDAGLDAGAAYVFRRNVAGIWVFEHKLLAADRFAGDLFGRSVAIARTNNSDMIVVGAPQDDDGGSATGSAYVFRNSGAAWVQEQKLVAPDPAANDQFGQSVDIGYSLADTSQWVIVGAWMEDAAASDSGSAYLYQKGANWNFVTKIFANDGGPLDQFGFDVALAFADDVKLAFAGAWKHNHNSVSNTGAAYVFASTGSSWSQELKIVPADALAEDSFGVCVDAHEDGLIVGSYLADTAAADAGAAYIFRRNGTGWTQEAKLQKDAPTANEQAGFGAGLGAETALVGVWLDDTVNSDAGALLVSSRGAAPPFNDCNKNGIPDECDILSGTSLDLNGNGIPDECEEPPPACAGDVNNSGTVDSDDLVAVVLAWGSCPAPPAPCPSDANNSGAVDSDDLVLVILNWGACP